MPWSHPPLASRRGRCHHPEDAFSHCFAPVSVPHHCDQFIAVACCSHSLIAEMLKKLKPTKSLKVLPLDNALAPLLRELAERERLLDEVKPLLPVELRGHCSQAAISTVRREKTGKKTAKKAPAKRDAGQSLLLFADSPVWAARIRLLAPEILAALRARGQVLESCQVRVCPPLFGAGAGGENASSREHTTSGAVLAPRLSPLSAAHLEQAARTMADPRMADCLRRIASRAAEKRGGGA
jgi:hypothetical protein